MKTLILVIMLSFSAFVSAESFNDSIFYKVAKEKKIDPLLLYAVAYICSANQVESDVGAPNPLMLIVDGKRVSSKNIAIANQKLKEARYSSENINIGLMAISLKFYPHEYPDDLFDPSKNLELGADILKDLLNKNENPVIAVGKYFSPLNEETAVNYGERAWALRNNIETYFKPWGNI